MFSHNKTPDALNQALAAYYTHETPQMTINTRNCVYKMMMANRKATVALDSSGYLDALEEDEVNIGSVPHEKRIINPFPFCFVTLNRMEDKIKSDALSILDETTSGAQPFTYDSMITDLITQSILDAADIAYIYGVVAPTSVVACINEHRMTSKDIGTICIAVFNKLIGDYSSHSRVNFFLSLLQDEHMFSHKIGAVINLCQAHFVFVMFDMLDGTSTVFDSMSSSDEVEYGACNSGFQTTIATYAYVLMYIYRVVHHADHNNPNVLFTARSIDEIMTDMTLEKLAPKVISAQNVPQQGLASNNCGFYSTLFAMRFKYTVTLLTLQKQTDIYNAVTAVKVVEKIPSERDGPATRARGMSSASATIPIRPEDLRAKFLHNVNNVKK